MMDADKVLRYRTQNAMRQALMVPTQKVCPIRK